MDGKQIRTRLIEMAAQADDAIELALKLKGGVLVARSPLFMRGQKVPMAERHVELYKPRGRKLKPGQIHADSAKKKDPHLAYTVTGPKQNYVKVISSPHAADKKTAMANVGDAIGIRKAFTGHLDRSGIVSRTHASSFGHEAIPTPTLMRHYRGAGFKVDVGAAKAIVGPARAANGREYATDFLRNWAPMIRKPKPPTSKA